MKFKFAFFAAVMSLFFASGLALPVTMASSATSSASLVLSVGDKSVLVAALQKLLIKQGYLNVAAPTGYFGTVTKSAVIAFQKAHNLPTTGTMTIPPNGSAVLFASAAATSSFSPSMAGSTGAQVKVIQQYLIRRGFLHLTKTTGYFGAVTKAAVIAFQKSNNLPQTGVVDQVTLKALGGN